MIVEQCVAYLFLAVRAVNAVMVTISITVWGVYLACRNYRDILLSCPCHYPANAFENPSVVSYAGLPIGQKEIPLCVHINNDVLAASSEQLTNHGMFSLDRKSFTSYSLYVVKNKTVHSCYRTATGATLNTSLNKKTNSRFAQIPFFVYNHTVKPVIHMPPYKSYAVLGKNAVRICLILKVVLP